MSTAARGQRLRLRYCKDEVLKYVGHLDLLRFAIRCLRIAQLPLAWHGSFSLKPRLSFGPPLPLGVSASNELLDIELAVDALLGADELAATLDRLRAAAAPREFALALVSLDTSAPSIARLAVGARYHLSVASGSLHDLTAACRLLCDALQANNNDPRLKGLQAAELASGELVLSGAAAGSSVLNLPRVAGYLHEVCGLTASRMHRQWLLDSGGGEL